MRGAHLVGRSGPVDAVVHVPGSKSVANRALLCAALAREGVSHVINIPSGDDCAAMMDALRSAGCVTADGGLAGGLFPGHATRFDAGIAGTTSRFLTAVAALSDGGVVIDGGEPLRRRPMEDLHTALRSLGATVEDLGEPGHLPVRVSRGQMNAPSETRVRGDVSSQFISALMLVAPCLEDGLRINVEGDLVSRPYVEMTADVMRAFGATVVLDGAVIQVDPGGYIASQYVVEPDYSSAAFPLMSLAFTEGRVRIPDLATARLQGDSYVTDIARMMGLSVGSEGSDIVIERSAGSTLRAVDLDLRDSSDLVPAVAVACSVIPGTSRLTGIGFIRSKESDRLGDLANELSSAGARITVDNDGLTIQGVERLAPTRSFVTHHDHRLGMAFSLLAAGGVTCSIDDEQVVSKSWPTYFSDMQGVLGTVSGVK